MLRPATSADLDAILAWRNQDANREVSLTTHVISPSEHRAWWDRVDADPTRHVLVHESDGVPCGAVSFFDVTPTVASWGFYLDHDGLEERGGTLGVWMAVMREASAHAFDDLGVDELRGEVSADNRVVRQMNRRFGFTETGEEQVVDGRTFLAICLTRDEHARRVARRARRDTP
ncbi:GNAT family N-acetyltransferase [Solicola sp. PLA-1-18]|uniref:GNAT family N-acetyltransferase n=1 Tax=Solicola sp. PLA-1-18 TaxID=3380532 RepID=UPI003B78E7E8